MPSRSADMCARGGAIDDGSLPIAVGPTAVSECAAREHETARILNFIKCWAYGVTLCFAAAAGQP
jgi:hypothetical protein